MIKVAVNGSGRIGRQTFKVWFDKQSLRFSSLDRLETAGLKHQLLDS